jgi:hypothetical protein
MNGSPEPQCGNMVKAPRFDFFDYTFNLLEYHDKVYYHNYAALHGICEWLGRQLYSM